MENKEFVISIVTPSYNQGEFLEQTIQSVLSQEGDFFIEYIIMDGGSKDESVNIIKKYEKLLNNNCIQRSVGEKIFYVSNKNSFEWNKCKGISYSWVSESDGGQINALNKGFNKSTGTILAWINSDDYYLDENVFALIRETYLKDISKVLITADGLVVDREGNESWQHIIGRVDLRELIYLDYHIFQPSTFFYRGLLEEHKFNKSYKSTFDADFFISILNSVDNNFVKLHEKISAFRMYGENITDDKKLKWRAFQERLRIIKTYSSNNFFYFLSSLYHLGSYVIQARFENTRLSRIYMNFFDLYKNFCYKIILKERYSDRYIIK